MVTEVLTSSKLKVTIGVTFVAMFLLAFVYVQPAGACWQTPQQGTYQNISVQVAHHMIERDDCNRILILDVRYQCEYSIGHLYGAVLIPYDQLEERISELHAYKNSEIIVYCKSGYRSQIAAGILANHSFSHVYNMEGGILAWIDAGYQIYTTYHYTTVNLVKGELHLKIDPLLLHYTGSLPCTQNQTCTTCEGCGNNNTITVGNNTTNIHSEVLKQDENQTVIQVTLETNRTVFEITVNNTMLWNYSEATHVGKRNAHIFSTTLTWSNSSMQFYNLIYQVLNAKYNLTLYTILPVLPLDSEVYGSASTIVNCAPVGKAEMLSSEYVEFNSSIDTLSHHYAILSYVAEKIGKLYEGSGDENLTKLAPSYNYMRAEIEYLSHLVSWQAQAYDKAVLRGSALLADACSSIKLTGCKAACALLGTVLIAAACSATGPGAPVCRAIMSGILISFCSWLCQTMCDVDWAALQPYGPDVVCKFVCVGCGFGALPCGVCDLACHLLWDYWTDGGGCPSLYVYNGSQYVSEGLLDIHANSDVVTSHVLVATPAVFDDEYVLRLTEHPKTISHIDQVELYATLNNGRVVQLPLVSAVHSQWGNVLPQLRFSDDWRTIELGANWNGGISQSIDLRFLALPPWLHAASFTFVIEGYNMIIK